MYQNPCPDLGQQGQDDFNIPKGSETNIPNNHEEVVSTPLATLHCFEDGLRSQLTAEENFVNYHNLPTGDYRTVTAVPTCVNTAASQDPEDDPYHVPNIFDLSEPQEEAEEEVTLEFDPPLTHYAELRGDLPLGYVWLPPSSPEPMPCEATPEQEVAAPVTPENQTSVMASGKIKNRKKVKSGKPEVRKKRQKRETTAEYQKRFTSPLSEELSDAPDGLLPIETRRKLFQD
ncbi:hypothetical protein PtrSN002B_009497 [Pyrenophora tritici-repentis]|uniref:Rrn6 domain containing protein n=2 Tax=Pyrenophora tritici-repentis TaxID=45151 RepID=A0A2W1CX09_9PLEO|nr:uncharacterized protein PTRG_06065 [Pyrenophora tritici-repentis Pt-1C-BFP]KAA8619200.1 hypothetical protein PtrV1_08629 [Pyrenophora tritici-repentis]EDU48985.1 predicted protein [Pyrenophora tritici-repentis Pt-1C-BFP]KAF7449671.1 hypothetical protein A1F99_067200 [Pyrenophora tritici-repentis]KAF7570208.1 Rrn6 domain containing protein [Pyrenophora tritici-repentis]KAG9383401.1 hypothetical protein A1F94_005312 [Pyrenophora tritici-repentis]